MNKVFYQLSTHWDREWYQPFQEFRFKLNEMILKIIDLLEKEEISKFFMDGQTIILEDFCQLYPDKREKLIKLISSKKLEVGPWYVMPDEFLVSGESLIKNLLVGKKLAENFSGVQSKNGYVCDIFGHIAQLPQIFNGFGIEFAYICRGVGDEKDNKSFFFVWESPNGSKCYTFKDGFEGAGYSCLYETLEKNGNNIEEYINKLKNDFGNPIIVLNYTKDHLVPDEKTIEFIRTLKSKKGIEISEEGIDKCVEILRNLEKQLPTKRGELATTAEKVSFRLAENSISSYYPLKYNNDKCQTILEKKFGPKSAFLYINGKNDYAEHMDLAYQYLLKNQPHDNICGCSHDDVHKNMEYRYREIYSIYKGFCRQFNKETKVDEVNNLYLNIFNPCLSEFNGPILAEIDFPADTPQKSYGNTPEHDIVEFALFDKTGQEVPYQIIDITEEKILEYNAVQQEAKVHKYKLLIDSSLSPFGITSLSIKPESKPSQQERIKYGENYAENAYIRFEITPSGRINLFDKRTQKAYTNLHFFEDSEEAGNGWFHENCMVGGKTIISNFADTTVERKECGNLCACFQVTKTVKIPYKLDYATNKRADEYVEMKISSEIRLYKDVDYIDITTRVVNNAKDHILRLNIPTGITEKEYISSQAFCFNTRHTGLLEGGEFRREPEIIEKNTDGIIGIRNSDGTGLAFISAGGLHEMGIGKDGNMSVTMLRSFGRVYLCDICEESQIQGEHVFRYGIAPLVKDTSNNQLLDVKDKLSDITTCITSNGNLAQSSILNGQIELSGKDIRLSIIKVSEDRSGVIVRLFNPENHSSCANIKIGSKISKIFTAKLSEDLESEIDRENLVLKFEPFEIKTLLLKID